MGDGTKEKPYTREDVLRLIKENGGTAEGLDLSGKVFEDKVDLSKLDLAGIILKKASLWCAHLEGAKLEYVDWGNHILGEEKGHRFVRAVDTYRRLKTWYSQSGYGDTAGKFYYREKEASRKALKWRWDFNIIRHRLALEFLRALFGYGEGWKRILLWIAGFILAFSLIDLAIGTFIPNLGTLTPNTFLHSLYYSAVSFTALGYGSWSPQPTGWIKALGAFESLVGISTMALLLVTFVRKWTR